MSEDKLTDDVVSAMLEGNNDTIFVRGETAKDEPAIEDFNKSNVKKEKEFYDTITKDAVDARAKKESATKEDSDKSVNEELENIHKLVLESNGSEKSKTEALGLIKTLVEKGKIMLFEDKDNIDDYTDEEKLELLEANLEDAATIAADNAISSFADSLPEDVKKIIQYALNGGTDYKTMFKMLSNYDSSAPLVLGKDDEAIVRKGLQLKGYGTAEEIEDEIKTYKKAGVLGDRAVKFKELVETNKKTEIDTVLKQQEDYKKLREEAAKKYVEKVGEILSHNKISNVSMDRKTRADVYNGLTATNYKLTDGRATNEYGYLLEKYQMVEPDFERVVLSFLALKDPALLKDFISKNAETEVSNKVYRTLKTEAANGPGMGGTDVSVDTKSKNVRQLKVEKRPFNSR